MAYEFLYYSQRCCVCVCVFSFFCFVFKLQLGGVTPFSEQCLLILFEDISCVLDPACHKILTARSWAIFCIRMHTEANHLVKRKNPQPHPPPWREQKRTNWFVCCLSCQDRPRLGFGQREGLYVWVIQMLRQGPEISRLWVQLVDITGDLRQQLLLLGLWHPPKPDGYRGRGMTGWIIGSLLWLCLVLSPALVPTVDEPLLSPPATGSAFYLPLCSCFYFTTVAQKNKTGIIYFFNLKRQHMILLGNWKNLFSK